MPTEYAIYLRKSRADREAEQRGEGETLARHEQLCLEVAKKQGLTVTDIYKEVVSGESIEARPQMQRLLDAVEQGCYAGVIVVEVERLARGDTIDQGIVARAFSLSHTKIITPIKTYDPENEFDEEYFEFGLFMSRREYKTINRRIQRGRVASAKEGRFIGSTPPYGYDKVKIVKDKGYTLAPNGNEAPVVQRIYDMYNSGIGMIQIANALDKDGIKPRNRDYWSRSTISDILRNPVYIGKIRWSYRPDVKQSTGGKLTVRRIKNPECIMVDGLHPALISEELFEEVQNKLQNHKKPPLKLETGLQNPLTGLIFCAKCGATMTRIGTGSHNPHATLRCSDRRCTTVSARLDVVERYTIKSLGEWLEKYKLKIKRELPTVIEFGVNERALNTAQAELEKIDKQIASTYDLLEQQVYDIETFRVRNQALAKKKSDLTTEIAHIQNDIEKAEQNRIAYSQIVPRVTNVLNTYYTLDNNEDRNALLRSVIEKILYRKDMPNRKGEGTKATFELVVIPRFYKK
ncbi:MAG: recombinase family protein [Ruminococcaceae bacterium]|nr:recombinase family protein [Oscillospiraceae bacterium]